MMVHMNEGELEGLDNLQGGPSVDPETGVREYSALATIIEQPEIRSLFHHVFDEIRERGDVSPDLKKIYHHAEEHSLPYAPTPEEKRDPLKKIEHFGRKGDNKLALLPENLVRFLIELMGTTHINPKTGLFEFFCERQRLKRGGGARGGGGSYKSNVTTRSGATVRTKSGAPVTSGARFTSAINSNNRITANTTNRTPILTPTAQSNPHFQEALAYHQGRKNAYQQNPSAFHGPAANTTKRIAVSEIGPQSRSQKSASQEGSWMGNLFRGFTKNALKIAGTIGGGMMGGPWGAVAGYGLGSMGQGENLIHVGQNMLHRAAGVISPLGSEIFGLSQEGMPDHSGGQSSSGPSNQSHSPSHSSTNHGFSSSLAIPLLMGAAGYLGGKRHDRHEDARYRAHKEDEERLAKHLEEKRKDSGMYDRWKDPAPLSRQQNLDALERSPEEIAAGVFPENFYLNVGRHARGGRIAHGSSPRLSDQKYQGHLIRGPGKGQQDKIKTSVPEGTYIIDASATSMLADGPTEKGAQILQQLEAKIKKQFTPQERHQAASMVERHASPVPVWLSDGEYAIDPTTVTLLGRGSNEKGSALLKKMVHNLRLHKTKKGGDLPPAAKPVESYFPKGTFHAR